jgi:IS30 family transposase
VRRAFPNGGRPRTLDDAKRREICALMAGGCGMRDIVRYVGCSRKTILRDARRNPISESSSADPKCMPS